MALTVLYEPVLLSLRRLAQAEESDTALRQRQVDTKRALRMMRRAFSALYPRPDSNRRYRLERAAC